MFSKTRSDATIFSKIIKHEIQADIIYQDKLVTAFRDIFPKAPVHIIVVPNVCIPTLNDIQIKDEPIIGRLVTVAAKIAKDEKIADQGYRLIMNCNQHGGQEIYHIHLHLIGGCMLGPIISDPINNLI
ncbi:MAG: HIT domain-containing protein [Candidatus Dasytiphilus stammeri]